jgi:hypothetical protein
VNQPRASRIASARASAPRTTARRSTSSSDPHEVADSWPDIPILGYTNHTDTSGLRAAHEAGLDQVVARSALAERAPQLVEELVT